MLTRDAETETMDIEDARAEWPEVLDRVRRGEARVLVAADGSPVAAVISAADFDRFRRREAEHKRDFGILDEIGAVFKDVPDEEIEREVSRAIDEVRAENRRRRQEGLDAAS